jgi:flagellar protein FlgJ
VLIAQAALETGWGQSVPAAQSGRSSYNLFGMKAGSSWRGETVAKWTVEYADGLAERRVEKFRTYANPGESFADYARLIGNNPRYAQALAHHGDAEAYARAVADAGYATDPDYAEKWLSVYRGTELNEICDALQIP